MATNPLTSTVAMPNDPALPNLDTNTDKVAAPPAATDPNYVPPSKPVDSTGPMPGDVAPTPVPGATPPPAPGSIPVPPVSTTPVTPPTSSAQPTAWNPTARTVGDDETVSGRLAALLKSGNPLFDQAMSQSNDQYNARGLLNSSLAQTAGFKAMLESALPIAQGDAAAYGHAADMTNQATNAAGQFNAGANNDFSARQQQSDLAIGQMQTASQLDQAAKERMLAIQQNFESLTKSNDTARGMIVNMNTQIASILANPDIALENKTQLINRLVFSAQQSLLVLGSMSGIDFGNLLDFSRITAGFPSATVPTQPLGSQPPPAGAPTPPPPSGIPGVPAFDPHQS